MDDPECQDDRGPLPRDRAGVDWWLRKWGRTEPLTRQDVERLIEANGGTAEELYLARRNIQGASLIRANLQHAILSGANLQGADLIGANLQGTDLSGANLQGADLSGADLQGADLRIANLQRAYLRGADLQGASLIGADLQGAELVSANLQGARLIEANLQGARLIEANLQGARLQGAQISQATNLEGVEWDTKYTNILESEGNYYEASVVYRRLKEWYRGAGMQTIAGDFHYREKEAESKAGWQRFWREIGGGILTAWRGLKGEDHDAPR